MRKNNIISNVLLILLFFLTVSCDNKKEALLHNVITLESTVGKYNLLNLSDYIEDIKYIPLETNDSVLIGKGVNIIYENEKIFTRSVAGCYLFDNKGVFCCEIGNRGQGPDDYLLIANTFIFEKDIYLLDLLGNKLLVYDVNGFLVENNNLRKLYDIIEKNSEYYFFHHIFPLKKDTFVMNLISPLGYYPKAILFETNQPNSKMIKEYPNYIKIDKEKYPGFSFCEIGSMYRFKEDVRVYKAINDTIFTIGQSLEMKEAFIFELGKFKLPLSIIESLDMDAFKNYIIPIEVFESFDHLFIKFDFGNNSPEPYEITNIAGRRITQTYVYGVFDKNTGKLSLMEQPIKGILGFKNDVDNGSIIWPHYISSNNELVTYILPEEFMDYYEQIENPAPQMTEIAKKINFDDNPIVIIAKLKEK